MSFVDKQFLELMKNFPKPPIPPNTSAPPSSLSPFTFSSTPIASFSPFSTDDNFTPQKSSVVSEGGGFSVFNTIASLLNPKPLPPAVNKPAVHNSVPPSTGSGFNPFPAVHNSVPPSTGSGFNPVPAVQNSVPPSTGSVPAVSISSSTPSSNNPTVLIVGGLILAYFMFKN
jgi:hypothetical protein